MNIDMDEELRTYQLRKLTDSRPSLAQWLFIIALGVFLGNIASFGIEKAVFYWELKQVATAASLTMKESTRTMNEVREIREAKLAEQRKIQTATTLEQKKSLALQDQQRQIKQEQKQAGLRQANETCNFWKEQLKLENTEQNRLYRNEACKIVSKFR